MKEFITTIEEDFSKFIELIHSKFSQAEIEEHSKVIQAITACKDQAAPVLTAPEIPTTVEAVTQGETGSESNQS